MDPWFMSLEGGADCQGSLRIPVEDVNELVLLDRGNKAGSSLGVTSKILPRDDATYTRLAKCLQVDSNESVLWRLIFKNGDPSRVAGKDEVV